MAEKSHKFRLKDEETSFSFSIQRTFLHCFNVFYVKKSNLKNSIIACHLLILKFTTCHKA